MLNYLIKIYSAFIQFCNRIKNCLKWASVHYQQWVWIGQLAVISPHPLKY